MFFELITPARVHRLPGVYVPLRRRSESRCRPNGSWRTLHRYDQMDTDMGVMADFAMSQDARVEAEQGVYLDLGGMADTERGIREDSGLMSDTGLQDGGVQRDAHVRGIQGMIEDTGDELALLFVGNSYIESNQLHDVVCELARQTRRWNAVRCERVTSYGHRLFQHALDAASGLRIWRQLDPENEARPVWDAVILQGQSQIQGFPEGHRELREFRQAIVDLDRLIVAIGAETALIMTWGRRDGDRTNREIYPDYPTMQARLQGGYEAAARNASTADRTVHVIPVGAAWQQTFLRSVDEDFPGLYHGDGTHPALPGTYLSALVILNYLTGVHPQDLGPLNMGPDANLADRLKRDAQAVEYTHPAP
jgi:hypothetical protein